MAEGLTKMTTCEPSETLLNAEKIDANDDQWKLGRETERQNEPRISHQRVKSVAKMAIVH